MSRTFLSFTFTFTLIIFVGFDPDQTTIYTISLSYIVVNTILKNNFNNILKWNKVLQAMIQCV